MNNRIKNYATIFLVAMSLFGMMLYYFLPDSTWAGAGIMASVTSLGSIIHIRFMQETINPNIESTQTWVLLLMTGLAVASIIFCQSAGHSDFYIGMGAGLAFVTAVTYCIILIIRYDQSVR